MFSFKKGWFWTLLSTLWTHVVKKTTLSCIKISFQRPTRPKPRGTLKLLNMKIIFKGQYIGVVTISALPKNSCNNRKGDEEGIRLGLGPRELHMGFILKSWFRTLLQSTLWSYGVNKLYAKVCSNHHSNTNHSIIHTFG